MMKKLFIVIILLFAGCIYIFGQRGYARPWIMGHPSDSSAWQSLKWNPDADETQWITDGTTPAQDSILYITGDSICVIDAGDTVCVSQDSFYITDTTLCVIQGGDTICTPYTSGGGVTLYTGDGALNSNRSVGLNAKQLRFLEGSTSLLTFNQPGVGPRIQLELPFYNSDAYPLLSLTSNGNDDMYFNFNGQVEEDYSIGVERLANVFTISTAESLSSPFFQHYNVEDSISILSDYFNFDLGTLFGDGPNNRVGIGTSSPSRTLDVLGSADISDAGRNIVIGSDATVADQMSGATDNVIIGQNTTATALTSGDYNIIAGYSAGGGISTGTGNIAIGYFAGDATTTGDSNVYVGFRGGDFSVNGNHDRNVVIGAGAGTGSGGGDGNVFLGHMAGPTGSSPNNTLYIDNSQSNTPLIFGDFSNDYVLINGGYRLKLTETASTSYGSISSGESTLSFTATGAKTATLPQLTLSTQSYRIFIANNAASDNITVSAGSGDTITGDSTIEPGTGVLFISVSNALWFTISTN